MATLTPGNGGTDLVAYLFQRMKAFGRAGLLKPVYLAGLFQRAAQADRGRDIKASVGVNQHLDIGTGRFARC